VTEVARSSINAVLEACRLDYRLRGAGTPEEAERTLQKLRAVSTGLAPDQRDLHAFLLAEALDATSGEAAALDWLRTHAELADESPLVAIGWRNGWRGEASRRRRCDSMTPRSRRIQSSTACVPRGAWHSTPPK